MPDNPEKELLKISHATKHISITKHIFLTLIFFAFADNIYHLIGLLAATPPASGLLQQRIIANPYFLPIQEGFNPPLPTLFGCTSSRGIYAEGNSRHGNLVQDNLRSLHFVRDDDMATSFKIT